MALLKFKKGLLANLSSINREEGTIYITTDERAIYLDTATERIRLGDFQEYATLEDIFALNPEELQSTALYYAANENILVKYDDSNKIWKQINPDTYVASVVVEAGAAGTSAGVNVNTTITHGGGKNTTVTGSLNVVGRGATTVSAEGKKLIITSTDTDTKVTSVDNHYDPKNVETNKQTAADSEGEGFVTSVTTDGKGHIIKLTKSPQTTNAVTGVDTSITTGTNEATVTTQVTQKIGGNFSDSFKVLGAGKTTVTADATQGTITISSTDTHTTKDGHYSPSADASSALGVENGKTISKINRDNKGHIVSVETRGENDLNSVEINAEST